MAPVVGSLDSCDQSGRYLHLAPQPAHRHEGVRVREGSGSGRPGLQGAEVQTEGRLTSSNATKGPGAGGGSGRTPAAAAATLEGGVAAPDDAINLQRRVGLISGVALIVGTMIGSGIFVSPKGLLQRTESVGLSLVVWAACGVLSLLGALCYVELGCLIPTSGAEHTYFLTAFGHLPAFLFAWVTIILLKPAMLAIICLSFAKYLVEAFATDCEPPATAINILGALTIGALSYAELGTLVAESGGEYAYFNEAFHRSRPSKTWYGPVPAFLFSWVSILLLKPSGLAIIALTCAEYSSRLFILGGSDCHIPGVSVKLLASCVIVLITFINSYSVNLATKVQNIFTAAKLVAIVIIVVGGMIKLAQGNTQYLEKGFEGSTTSAGNIATAFYSGLWAYDGWNNLNYVTEELKNPYKNLPRAIIIGLPLVTVCYLLVNVSYLAVMSTEELLSSETVAVTFGNRVLGWAAFLMPLAVTLSTFGAANGTAFTSGRLCFVAAREGHMVDVLSYVHTKKLTPSPALLFNAAIALVMVVPSNIGSLIDFFGFTAWIFYGGAMLALIVMRFTKKDSKRPYKVPIIIPIVVLIMSFFLVVLPIIDSPQIEYLYATLFIVAGLIFYFPFVHFQKSLPIMGHVTTFFQLLLEVVPTDVMPDAA
ncbi:L-type amino acid transporter sobremesa isoform X2 [Oratosquilla oratoria]|uniref:L-type amino acid transporter sobremesa isoform X2 n=1 Tax=Oratosquilla oratoria TaxID=337810 RepID=UPI003F7722B5